MAVRKPGGGLKGSFNNRGQFPDGSGRQVKVDTAKGEVLKVREDGRLNRPGFVGGSNS